MAQDLLGFVGSFAFQSGWTPAGWLRADDAARRLGVCRERVRQLAASGSLRRLKVAGVRGRLYSARDVATLAARRSRADAGG